LDLGESPTCFFAGPELRSRSFGVRKPVLRRGDNGELLRVANRPDAEWYEQERQSGEPGERPERRRERVAVAVGACSLGFRWLSIPAGFVSVLQFTRPASSESRR
jgi:hypothetical protein